jgi:hypothetical protein
MSEGKASTAAEVFDAMQAYFRREREYHEAVNECEYDAGYFCAREERAANDARKDAEQKLDDYIDDRIAKAFDMFTEAMISERKKR